MKKFLLNILAVVAFINCCSVSGGTTWHAAGLVNPFRGEINAMKLSQYAIDLFPKLEQETDASTGMRICFDFCTNIWSGSMLIVVRCHRLEELWCCDGC